MVKRIFTVLLIVSIIALCPAKAGSSELCCKDYGGYIPAAGIAYENACLSPCFSPCLAVGFVAIASIVTIIILQNNSGKTGIVIHAHSE